MNTEDIVSTVIVVVIGVAVYTVSHIWLKII